jgi:hypothetical protein
MQAERRMLAVAAGRYPTLCVSLRLPGDLPHRPDALKLDDFVDEVFEHLHTGF